MTLGDWCDAAWSALFDDAPALANPGEYRRMIYEAFYEGKIPKPSPTRSGKGNHPTPAPPSSPPPRHALLELERERAYILALQAERAAAK